MSRLRRSFLLVVALGAIVPVARPCPLPASAGWCEALIACAFGVPLAVAHEAAAHCESSAQADPSDACASCPLAAADHAPAPRPRACYLGDAATTQAVRNHAPRLDAPLRVAASIARAPALDAPHALRAACIAAAAPRPPARSPHAPPARAPPLEA